VRSFSERAKIKPMSQEYTIQAIMDAGREETRRNRITKAIQMLLQTSKDS
jgi:uncharacterized protein YdeI (YjbR/CyaY-like superfamily)